jgi:hypothetical protein
MITRNQYKGHIAKLSSIYNNRGVIKSDSRLEKTHSEAKKLRKINYEFMKKGKANFF